MFGDGAVGLFVGAITLGVAHGITPDHGWPVASMYALNRERTWLHGVLSGFILGVGHLVSSIAVVVAYFFALGYFGLIEIHWLDYVAGAILIALGVREYGTGGHRHDHAGGHDHDHEHGHHHAEPTGRLARLRAAIPFVGDGHDHPHSLEEQADERGLMGIAAFAFALGFAHNEELEMIAICTGSSYCLELMLAYALAVLLAVITMTLGLIAGFEHYEDHIREYQGYLPTVTAAVLIVMGLAFIAGIV